MKPCLSSVFPATMTAAADTFAYERVLSQRGVDFIAGVDEAGRGPLAGPVVAACVVLPRDCEYSLFQDSKKLPASQREHLFSLLQSNGALVGVGMSDPREIEALNILQASLLAMKRAVTACAAANQGRGPTFLLVDGTFQVPVLIDQQTLVKGESKSASIAAASIIAKVTRDRLMFEAHGRYPQYGFDRHQGYPTKAHRLAVSRYGPCPLHRRTFRGVAEHLPSDQGAVLPDQGRLW